MATIPETPSLAGLEAKWAERWHDQRIYRFDRSKSREAIYAIDTPPPTISGSLHLGTAFGYIQVDAIARFQRMFGQEVFYPMGWDDNGLPTERRVQNHYGVRCDPTVPYDPDLVVTEVAKGDKAQRPISRPNFIDLCQQLTSEFEDDFEQQWRTMGLSVDWDLTYATINDRSRRVSQLAFLRNLRRGEAYAADGPTMWDVDFQTAVAQAEFEDREVNGAFHRLAFPALAGGPPVEIETTRPELLVSCVALVTHPDDDRYQHLVGTKVITPLFGVEVPVHAHPLAEPDKGTGIAMICTFGDTTDVVWWRQLGLPLRSVIQRDGRFQAETPAWLIGAGADAYAELAGKTSQQARRAIAELLRESGGLIGEPRPTKQQVKFFEKGDRPLEIVTSRQWYIRNGARDDKLRAELLAAGRELDWHPDYMRVRYEHWVQGLNTDWLISRQRYFGVPFPIWYKIADSGDVLWDQVITADDASLPVDPQADAAPGYDQSQRGQPGGFTGDPDIMDTWATSSLTPQITSGWIDDPDLHARIYPFDLRPQGPEIIRTWLFSTLLRAHFEDGVLPWRHATINGWILDPDRKKMSKSKDNVLTPMPLVEEFGADGLRHWACRAAPGTDTAADRAQMRVGRRLAVKVLNASKFVLGLGSEPGTTADVTEPVDRAMLAQLADVVDDATEAFGNYEYHRALERAETFFWKFCDDYVELVKVRAYHGGDEGRSAETALSIALSVLLRLFAPILPFVTEEVWSWWQEGSVHRAQWPASSEFAAAISDADPAVLDVAGAVLGEVRKAKSAQKRSQRHEVTLLRVQDEPKRLAVLELAETDLRHAGVVTELVFAEGSEQQVLVDLAPDAPVPA
jgi:valyl-tRNA synthetase